MLMKIFNKGQIVIPAQIRKLFGIQVGDCLDVSVNQQKKCLELRTIEKSNADILAGSLSRYHTKKFPNSSQIKNCLAEGLLRGK
jgi:AbrB family looped-hinge helix DNA binding protein